LGDIRQFVEIDPSEWEGYLDAEERELELNAIRRNTIQGRPYGGKKFVEMIGEIAGISFRTVARGRPKKYDKKCLSPIINY
jgi:hypothetical protein